MNNVFYIFLFLLSSVSWANHPRPDQMKQVKHSAHLVEDNASTLYHQILWLAPHDNQAEQDALENLRVLSENANIFHRQVEYYYEDPSQTENDFYALKDAYLEARRTFRQLHAYAQVEYLLQNVSTNFRTLQSYYWESDNGSWNGRRVQQLAYELQSACSRVQRQAQKENWGGDYKKDNAVRALRNLLNSATHFYRQAANPWHDPSHTEHDFQNLKWAYQSARQSLAYAGFSLNVRQEFRRVAVLLRRLSYYYSGDDHHNPHPRPVPRPQPPHHPQPHHHTYMD